MRIKRRLAVFLVIFLVILTIVGISSYFISFDSIRSTFIVGNFEEEEEIVFTLKEHEVLDKDKDGVYELGSGEVESNSYSVYPGVNIPKDPFIRLSGLNSRAYLFVEVVGDNDSEFSWSVNSKWLKTTIEGKKGGKVYVYKGSSNNEDAEILEGLSDNELVVYILSGIEGSENGGIVVPDSFNSSERIGLTFYGYLVKEEGFDNYKDAYNSIY